MNKKIILVLLFLPTLLFAKKVINSGHQTPVKFIKYYELEDSFFSLSEDGTLVIKKSTDKKISRRFFLTNSNITQFVLSNKNNQLAIVESDNSTTFRLTVWDWKKEKKLYSINLTEFPMSIGFTGGGNYIFVTSISSKPIKIYNARSGAPTTNLNKTNTFIDYVYVGSSETYAFLYSSSGKLDIRSFRDSKLNRSVVTEKNLTNISVTPDKKYFVAQKNNTIYIIVRNTGIVYAKKEISDLSYFTQNSFTGDLICYINNRYKKSISILQIVAGDFFESSSTDILVKNPIDKMCFANNSIIYTDIKGNLIKYDLWSKESSIFLNNDIIDIQDITIINDTALLSTNDKIYSFKSPFFSDKIKNTRRLLNFTIEQFDSPIKNPVGSINYNKSLIIWNDSIARLDLETGETIFNHMLTSEIVDVKILENQMICLDKNGYIKIINLITNDVTFTFKSPGFTSISFYDNNEIIGGINSSLGGSLMTVDTITKETQPIKTSLDVVFEIVQSKKSYIVYLLGTKKLNGNNITRFIEYNLLTKQERILLKQDTEELYSSFEIDNNGNIYTNLSSKSLIKINSQTRKIKPFETTTNQTKNILFENGGIFTINENKSLSIWNPSTGKKLIDFYLFKDDEWVAISKDGISAIGSNNSDKYISSN
ncbi:MAG: hypothetical protein OCD02_10910 [Spirochaetaceae bacterium]